MHHPLKMTADSWWTFMMPLISLTSIFANVFNVAILSHLRCVNSIYRLLYVKSVLNAVYLFVCFWIFLDKCGHYCEPAPDDTTSESSGGESKSRPPPSALWSLVAQFYKFYLYSWLASMLAHCDLLIELLVALKRLHFLATESSELVSDAAQDRRRRSYCCCRCVSTNCALVAVFTLSVCVYSPLVVLSKVVRDEPMTTVSTELNSTARSLVHTIAQYRIVISNESLRQTLHKAITLYLRGALMALMLVLFTIANCWHLSKRVRNNSSNNNDNNNANTDSFIMSSLQLNTSLRSSDGRARAPPTRRSLRTMLFYQSLVYVCGNLVFVVSPLLFVVMPDGPANPYFVFVPLANNTLLFTSLALNTVVYLMCDKQFNTRVFQLLTPEGMRTLDLEEYATDL